MRKRARWESKSKRGKFFYFRIRGGGEVNIVFGPKYRPLCEGLNIGRGIVRVHKESRTKQNPKDLHTVHTVKTIMPRFTDGKS